MGKEYLITASMTCRRVCVCTNERILQEATISSCSCSGEMKERKKERYDACSMYVEWNGMGALVRDQPKPSTCDIVSLNNLWTRDTLDINHLLTGK